MLMCMYDLAIRRNDKGNEQEKYHCHRAQRRDDAGQVKIKGGRAHGEQSREWSDCKIRECDISRSQIEDFVMEKGKESGRLDKGNFLNVYARISVIKATAYRIVLESLPLQYSTYGEAA